MIPPIERFAAVLAAEHDFHAHVPHIVFEGLLSLLPQFSVRHARRDDKFPASAKHGHERAVDGVAGAEAKCVHTFEKCPRVHLPQRHVAEG